jgi:bifunctional non-homologous end joining protein LigD
MAKKLAKYRAKRDFEQTPEPGPDGADGSEEGRFVVQEHHARRLHWDLRLERDGVLVSWAVPRGIPDDPKRNHLAVHVEDHPLDYIDFAGEIPKGEYGAGKVKIWDSGTYETHKWRDDEVMVTFHGERVNGKYVLFRTRGDDWMIHRMDPPVDPDREPMPERIDPMLAKLGQLPRRDQDFGYEIKWDGIRAIAYVDSGRITLRGRRGNDITERYPELRALGRELGTRPAILDGEIVAFDERGRPSFERLQGRMHVTSDSAIRRRARDTPATYILFDALYLDGRLTLDRPYTERRDALESLELEGDHWRTPAYHRGDGRALLQASAEQGLEGIVGKRLDSRYEPGKRSGAWVKVKNVRRQPLVIGGWAPGEGARSSSFGALLVGYHSLTFAEARERHEEQRLTYAGKVGTGFSDATLDELQEKLEPLRRDDSPFEGRQPPKRSIFVEPKLVADVRFTEWTRSGTVRAPVFEGLRSDVDPRDVVRKEAHTT